MRLEGKTALITGGESGIGLATARLFAQEGAKLHLVGIEQDAVTSAAGELDALGSIADVTDEAAVERAVADGVERFGGYDVIFSNAGISGEITEVPDYPTDVFERVLDVHVLGAFLVLKHTIPHVHDGGSIVITSSVAGKVGFPGLSGYCTAKHAQVGLMRRAGQGARAAQDPRQHAPSGADVDARSRTTSRSASPARNSRRPTRCSTT